METKYVKDLMTPFEDYLTVSQNATLLEVIAILEKSQVLNNSNPQPLRPVLVVDDNRKVVGKIGPLGCLKALDPKYNLVGADVDKLSKIDEFDASLIDSMMDNLVLVDSNLTDAFKRAQSVKVKDIMYTVVESIDENASIVEAIHTIVKFQTLSILVMRKSEVVGILHLADLYKEIVSRIKLV